MDRIPDRFVRAEAPRRLLVRGANWLGDAVMTTPALRHLRAVLPATRITLLTRSKLAELWRAHPALDEVLCIEPPESVWSVGRKLRSQRFDAALLFPNSPRSALEVWLAGIPRRIGFQRAWRNWLLTDAVPTRPGHLRMRKRAPAEIRRLIQQEPPPGVAEPASTHMAPQPLPIEVHQTFDYLYLSGALGGEVRMAAPQLRVEDNEIAAASSRFEITANLPWVGINAGAEYGPAKRWPAERFAAVARAVQQQAHCGVLLFGGPGDAAISERLRAGLPSSAGTIRDVSGRTSLRELMALLARCQVLLTNDTGPMHLAAALGVTVVVPFGSTSAELTGPGEPGNSRHRLIRSNAPCAPCFLRSCPIDFRCMNDIPVEPVVNAVLTALETGRTP